MNTTSDKKKAEADLKKAYADWKKAEENWNKAEAEGITPKKKLLEELKL